MPSTDNWPSIEDLADQDWTGEWEPQSGLGSVQISESVGQQSEAVGSFHAHTRSSGTFVWEVFPAVQDKETLSKIIKSFIGGWDGKEYKQPMPHPLNPDQSCTDVQHNLITPNQDGDNIDDNTTQTYERSVFTCEYRTLPFPVGGDNRFVMRVNRGSYQRRQLPTGYMVFTDDNTQAGGGFYQSEGISYVVVQCYGVPHSLLFPGDTTPLSAVDKHVGKINSDVLGAIAKETLLFEAIETGEAYLDAAGKINGADPRRYDPQLIFTYKSTGWQNAAKADGSFKRVKYSNGGADLWPTTALGTVIQSLAPDFTPASF